MLTIKHFTFNPIAENTYLLFNANGESAIIDPGCYFENERKELTDFIDTHKLVPKFLLNTHCHLDHVFGNKLIGERYHLPLHIHPAEQPVLDAAPISGNLWNLPFDNFSGEVRYLREGEQIELAGARFVILFTPGHSPGSVSFYCAEQKILISGDVLFRQGIGRTDLPGGNHQQLLRSIREQLLVFPDDTVVYPGHGPATTIGEERRENPFLV